jgi:adenylate kinase
MFLALTGTPGTGKTTIASILKRKGISIISLKDLAEEQNFIESFDETRKSSIIDLDAVEQYLKATYPPSDMVVVIEGHLSHLISDLTTIVVLRCHPQLLRQRLSKRNWNWNKIKENLEAEILDIILCEAVQQHGMKKVNELNTTECSAEKIASDIQQLIRGKKDHHTLKPGSIDWSELLFDPQIMEQDKDGSG